LGDRGSRIALEPGQLWPALRERTRSALACGALLSLPSECHLVPAAGVPFLVRVLGALDPRRQPAVRHPAPSSDPFLPHDPALFVADVSDTHIALLNKFNVVPHHLLLVTREFRSQDEALDARDFAALWSGLREIDGLGFYNGGAAAGASQSHKHLQIVPAPLGPGAAPIPVEPLLSAAVPASGIARCAALPFPHALASTERLARCEPVAAGRESESLYRALMEAVGCTPGRATYNLLVTRRFALLVPRAREDWEGMSINSLGFAGSLLARDAAGLDRIREHGPLAVLAAVTTGPSA